MRLALNLAVFNDRPLDAALDKASELGIDGIELNFDMSDQLTPLSLMSENENLAKFRRSVCERGLEIAAIGNHQDAQLISGGNSADTDNVLRGSCEEKRQYGIKCLLETARLASELEVTTVVGFTGCSDWSRWFPWPDKLAWDKMLGEFVETWTPILDEFRRLGVRFAHEPHPKQMAYNLETAIEVRDALGARREWGYNLDIGNLSLSGVDPVIFIRELDDRIFHVHAKDFEMVKSNAARSGWQAHGNWDRPDRGFRFRIPGWGDARWKDILTELQLAHYDGHLSIEHEDPVFSRAEGAERSVEFLRGLIIRDPPEAGWW